jgi:N-acetylglucosaminyl-diphospho-decaprenol L-rhamnosyltransferase
LDQVKSEQIICVSIVSHGHGSMVSNLARQILSCPEVGQLILTFNIPENCPKLMDQRILLINNESTKGFAENHNAAFGYCSRPYFCVVNPDIELLGNPFSKMLELSNEKNIGIVAPLVVNPNGHLEDSMRTFLTPWTLFKRLIKAKEKQTRLNGEDYAPDWVAGMFMLFKSETFKRLGGFDEKYRMYCEDADICTRSWKLNLKVIVCPFSSVFHFAQRASHRNIIYFFWHVQSLLRYFKKHLFRFPKKDI